MNMYMYMYIYMYMYMYMYIYTYAQCPHQDLPFMNTSDLNNIQPSSLNCIPLPSGLNCRFLLKREWFFKGKTSIKTKELDWKGTGFT